MSYTALVLVAAVLVVLVDLFGLRTRMVTRKAFWVAYAIILFFQLLVNGVLTGLEIVTYSEDVILGARVVFAPVEDVLFGFAMVTLTLSTWIWLGRRGIDR